MHSTTKPLDEAFITETGELCVVTGEYKIRRNWRDEGGDDGWRLFIEFLGPELRGRSIHPSKLTFLTKNREYMWSPPKI